VARVVAVIQDFIDIFVTSQSANGIEAIQ